MTLDSLPDLDTSGLCLVKTLPTALTCWPYRNMALRDGARTSTRTSSVAKGRTASIHCRPAPPRQTEALSSRTSRSRPLKTSQPSGARAKNERSESVQILALGRLGCPLRRTEEPTGVRRGTASGYLKAAGIAIRAPRRRRPPPKPASEVSTDPRARPPRLAELPAWPPPSNRAPTASACAPYRELIELALSRGRNALAIWPDLVDEHGFPARNARVRRLVVKLRGQRTPDAHPVITTAPGEEGQV